MVNIATHLWMCLHFKALPLEIYTRTQLETANDTTAIVIIEKHRVYHTNNAAKLLGIQVGNSMDTAYTLSDKVISFERSIDKETNVLAHLAQWAYQFTPNVSIKSPNCLLLDIHGCLKLFKGLNALINKVEIGLSQLGYTAIISVNTTPLAALLLAQANANKNINTRQGPQRKKALKHSIGQLPIQHLKADNNVIKALKQMGIANITALLELPLNSLTRRFGVYFNDYLQRLIGSKPDPQKFISPNPKFFSTIHFLSDVTNINALIFPINRLLDELSAFLTMRQFCISHFTWCLSHRDLNTKNDQATFSISLAKAINEPKVFLALTQLRLDQINNIEAVDSITLSVKQFTPLEVDSLELPLTNSLEPLEKKANSEQSLQLINTLNAKLGPNHCFGLSEANDHRPEKAWRVIHLDKKDYWFPKESSTLPRPTFLLPTPKALTKHNEMPYLGGKLDILRGPERIDYGWWDQALEKPLTRDYYIASQKDGTLYWIFQHIAMREWYLHGIFS